MIPVKKERSADEAFHQRAAHERGHQRHHHQGYEHVLINEPGIQRQRAEYDLHRPPRIQPETYRQRFAPAHSAKICAQVSTSKFADDCQKKHNGNKPHIEILNEIYRKPERNKKQRSENIGHKLVYDLSCFFMQVHTVTKSNAHDKSAQYGVQANAFGECGTQKAQSKRESKYTN